MQSLEVSCCGLSDEVKECSRKEEKNVLHSSNQSYCKTVTDQNCRELQGKLYEEKGESDLSLRLTLIVCFPLEQGNFCACNMVQPQKFPCYRTQHAIWVSHKEQDTYIMMIIKIQMAIITRMIMMIVVTMVMITNNNNNNDNNDKNNDSNVRLLQLKVRKLI